MSSKGKSGGGGGGKSFGGGGGGRGGAKSYGGGSVRSYGGARITTPSRAIGYVRPSTSYVSRPQRYGPAIRRGLPVGGNFRRGNLYYPERRKGFRYGFNGALLGLDFALLTAAGILPGARYCIDYFGNIVPCYSRNIYWSGYAPSVYPSKSGRGLRYGLSGELLGLDIALLIAAGIRPGARYCIDSFGNIVPCYSPRVYWSGYAPDVY